MSFNPFKVLKTILDYQFGFGAGDVLFPDNLINKMEIKFSKRTKRIRYVLLEKKPYLAVRTSDGFLTLSLISAKILLQNFPKLKNLVEIYNKFEDIIVQTKQISVKYVKNVDLNLKAGSEVIVINENKKLIGIGRTILNGEEMLNLKRGIAVKLRKVSKNV